MNLGTTDIYSEAGFTEFEQFQEPVSINVSYAPGPAATSDIEESAALTQEIENQAVLESVTPKKGPPVGLLALAALAAWGVFS